MIAILRRNPELRIHELAQLCKQPGSWVWYAVGFPDLIWQAKLDHFNRRLSLANCYALSSCPPILQRELLVQARWMSHVEFADVAYQALQAYNQTHWMQVAGDRDAAPVFVS